MYCDYDLIVFPTGRDSATLPDKGTEVPSLSRDKETMGQAQNLATGQAGPDFDRLSRPNPWDKKKRGKRINVFCNFSLF